MSETDTATQNITNSKIRHTATQDQLYGATTRSRSDIITQKKLSN